MLKLLLGLFTGPLTTISNDLKEAYQSKLSAQNDAQRIAADERIALLEARKSSILTAQQSPVERWVRILWAFPFVFYTGKCVLWDKVLGWGTTDALSPELYNIMMIILGGYFLETITKGLRK